MSLTLAQVRTVHQAIELSHAILYLCPEAVDEYEALGLEGRGQGYVAGRAAPLGPVGPHVTTATFYNFSPALHEWAVPAAWEKASPDELLAARARAVEAVFQRVEAPTDGLAELTQLAQQAAEGLDVVGRPLAAANASVALPGTPFADAWQALAVLREHRGDAHVALLLTEQVGPVEALVLMAAWQSVLTRRFFQLSRGWDDDTWSAAEQRLRERGLLDEEGELTDTGRTLRDHIEQRTDELSRAPFDRIGTEATRRLYDLVVPLVDALNDNGGYKRPAAYPSYPDR